jgi:transposase-like protein
MRKIRCADCGRRGHEAIPESGSCSRAFQAARAVAERGMTSPAAARLFGVLRSSVDEELRMFPGAREASNARTRELRETRITKRSAKIELAVQAVFAGQRVSIAAQLFGVHVVYIYNWMRKFHPGVVPAGYQKWFVNRPRARHR